MSNKPFAGKAIPVALAREHSDSAWPVIVFPTDEARDAAIRDLEAMAALRVTLKCAPEITEDPPAFHHDDAYDRPRIVEPSRTAGATVVLHGHISEVKKALTPLLSKGAIDGE